MEHQPWGFRSTNHLRSEIHQQFAVSESKPYPPFHDDLHRSSSRCMAIMRTSLPADLWYSFSSSSPLTVDGPNRWQAPVAKCGLSEWRASCIATGGTVVHPHWLRGKNEQHDLAQRQRAQHVYLHIYIYICVCVEMAKVLCGLLIAAGHRPSCAVRACVHVRTKDPL